MMGVLDETIHVSGTGWSPVWVNNLAVMSIQFMLPYEIPVSIPKYGTIVADKWTRNRDDAIIWRGGKKNGLIKKFLKDVEWGDLDFLLVDTPPGTSDEHLSVNSFLKESGIEGAVLLTTPNEVALLDVRKEIDFCRKANIRILGKHLPMCPLPFVACIRSRHRQLTRPCPTSRMLAFSLKKYLLTMCVFIAGLVENMSGFVCPNCTHESQIFRATTGGGAALAKETGIPFLGEVPLDPRIGMASDYGDSFLTAFPDSPASKALKRVVKGIAEQMGIDSRLILPDD
jgi:Mrp family chromosome partitioning ATPase